MGEFFVSTKEEASRVRLPHGDTDRLFKWIEKRKKVFFSVTRRGDAAEIHIASINGKRKLDRALNEFCDLLFTYYGWCNRVVGLTIYRSMIELGKRNKFKITGTCDLEWNGELREFTMLERLRK